MRRSRYSTCYYTKSAFREFDLQLLQSYVKLIRLLGDNHEKCGSDLGFGSTPDPTGSWGSSYSWSDDLKRGSSLRYISIWVFCYPKNTGLWDKHSRRVSTELFSVFLSGTPRKYANLSHFSNRPCQGGHLRHESPRRSLLDQQGTSGEPRYFRVLFQMHYSVDAWVIIDCHRDVEEFEILYLFLYAFGSEHPWNSSMVNSSSPARSSQSSRFFGGPGFHGYLKWNSCTL